MMLSNDRHPYRQSFTTAWDKYLNQSTLTPLEAEIIEVILEHPEYHQYLSSVYENQEFELKDNPFLHMSLHLALREQIRTNRPDGMARVHQQVLTLNINPHQAEHAMMQCLADTLWHSQQHGHPPTDEDYLACLNKLTSHSG